MNQYYCESASKRISSRGSSYLTITLNDTKDKLSASVWDAPDGVEPKDLQGRVLVVSSIEEKNGYKNIKWCNISAFEYDKLPEDSPLRKIQISFDVTADTLVHAVNSFISSFPEKWQKFYKWFPWLREFERFGVKPAGVQVHHAIKNGLLQHTLEALSIYKAMMKSSVLSEIRHEIVVISIAMHDSAKCEEYTDDNEVTEKMPLLGHSFMGAHRVMNLIDDYNRQVPESDRILESERDAICHCIIAHHYMKEWGAAEVPAIPEANLVYHCDSISATLNQFKNSTHLEKNYFLGTYVVKNY